MMAFTGYMQGGDIRYMRDFHGGHRVEITAPLAALLAVSWTSANVLTAYYFCYSHSETDITLYSDLTPL